MKTIFLAIVVSSISLNVFSFGEDSICYEDNRVPSKNLKVARALGKMTDPAGCTLTMISKNCALSAGHCTSTFGYAEFNTPASRNGKIQHPKATDIYKIDQQSIKYKNGGMGNDWAVMKIKKNSITGLYPGQVYGHYEVSFSRIFNGSSVRITGYGSDYNQPTRHFAQQTHTANLNLTRSTSSSQLKYNIDTMGGNSGSSVIDVNTNKVIGIHTHGGCSTRTGGSNTGTRIHQNSQLINAINSCLNSSL